MDAHPPLPAPTAHPGPPERVASRRGRLAAAAGFAALTAGAAVLGGIATSSSVNGPWYRGLAKPPWQPPSSAFGPVWTALYALMAGAGWRVWRADAPGRGRALAWWGAQLALNAAWSPLFFGLHAPRAALVDLALLVPAAGASAWTAARVDRASGWMLAPYVAWTGFALALNASIVARNG